MSVCNICRLLKNTRPFGKDATEICFACMKSTPEAEEEARKQVLARVDKLGAFAVLTERTPLEGLK